VLLVSTTGTFLPIPWWCCLPPSGPHGPSPSAIWSLHTQHLHNLPPMSFVTLLIQLKGESANWNSVPQKAADTQTPHSLYLVMMADCNHVLRSSPQHQHQRHKE
jgi:hypothetical protein